MKPTIKMIAVDMDGTFLNQDKKYDQERFLLLFHKMKEKGINFVAASGNQYPQLQNYFHQIENEMTFVAENGAQIVEKDEELYIADMGSEVANHAISSLEAYSKSPFIVCGKTSAYVHENIEEVDYQLFKKYYRKLSKVNNFHEIDDVIFKFATAFREDEVPQVLQYLKGEMKGKLSPISSGYGFIDLIQPGIHKGNAMNILQEKWNLSKDQCAAFGDSQNDLEMLQQVNFSFAMDNGDEKVKKVARKVIGDNNTEAVLDMIAKLIGE